MRASLIARFIPILTLAVLLTSAQEPWNPPLTSRIKTATRQVALFTNLETQMLLAVQKKDKPALSAMLTDDFAVEMPNADRMAGEDWLDSVMSKDFALEKFGVHQTSVIDLGSAAIVKYERLQQATQKGANENGRVFCRRSLEEGRRLLEAGQPLCLQGELGCARSGGAEADRKRIAAANLDAQELTSSQPGK